MVITKIGAIEALDYLKSRKANSTPPPLAELILLDINMPKMNGWEFLKEYKELAREFQSRTLVVMLTISDNPMIWTKLNYLMKLRILK